MATLQSLLVQVYGPSRVAAEKTSKLVSEANSAGAVERDLEKESIDEQRGTREKLGGCTSGKRNHVEVYGVPVLESVDVEMVENDGCSASVGVDEGMGRHVESCSVPLEGVECKALNSPVTDGCSASESIKGGHVEVPLDDEGVEIPATDGCSASVDVGVNKSIDEESPSSLPMPEDIETEKKGELEDMAILSTLDRELLSGEVPSQSTFAALCTPSNQPPHSTLSAAPVQPTFSLSQWSRGSSSDAHSKQVEASPTRLCVLEQIEPVKMCVPSRVPSGPLPSGNSQQKSKLLHVSSCFL